MKISKGIKRLLIFAFWIVFLGGLCISCYFVYIFWSMHGQSVRDESVVTGLEVGMSIESLELLFNENDIKYSLVATEDGVEHYTFMANIIGFYDVFVSNDAVIQIHRD